jgi:HAD superfamily hydrolase (TIGR01450 family)
VSGSLADRYDLFIFDLDGVVYVGREPVPGAVPALARLRDLGRGLAYATNNASRRATEVADLLAGMGAPADPVDVVTAAQATAGVLADRLPAGSRVLVVGADALAADLAEAGLRPVRSAADGPVAVAQGYGPEVGWTQLAEGCVAVRAGAYWVATNGDRTLPSERGPLPGNGALVAALATALGREPDLVVGKPAPALFEQAAKRHAASAPLVVGDRLDTDIEGANRAGMPSLLVLTGVTGAADLLDASAARRPTYLAADLGGLFDRADAVPILDGAAGWHAYPRGDELVLRGAGPAVAALRALCGAAWQRSGGGRPRTRADGAEAAAALAALGLPATATAGA